VQIRGMKGRRGTNDPTCDELRTLALMRRFLAGKARFVNMKNDFLTTANRPKFLLARAQTEKVPHSLHSIPVCMLERG